MHAHRPAALECEGELSSSLTEEALEVTMHLFDEAGSVVRRIDVGCGPGVGTATLVRIFPDATVVAVDNSRAMLEQTAARAAGLGHAGRVETRLLDLDGDLRSLGRCDLAWAAMSIYHAPDEVATLRALRSLIEPTGLLCVLERAEPLSVGFADELGRPGIWSRLEEAHLRWNEHMRPRLPGAMRDGAYPAMLAEAGPTVVVDRHVSRNVEVPLDPAMHPFVTDVPRRSLTDLTGFAGKDDLEALRERLEAPSPPDGWAGARSRVGRTLFVATAAS